MTLLDELLGFNQEFVDEKKYEQYLTTKFPNKRMVILTCMDTRLLELLPKALDIANGDVKIVKDAGALVTHPFGSVMRSILIAVYQLQAEEVLVIGHYDCGLSGLKPETMIEKMRERGIKEETIETLSYSGIKVTKWLQGFDDVRESVSHSVGIIQNHPLLPGDVPVHGLVIDPNTGKLDLVVNGYES
jgi:carbonic anhydrase